MAAHWDPSFTTRQQLLNDTGNGQPQMLLDLDALDHNLNQVARSVRGVDIRLVVKSLPSAPLLNYCAKALSTRKFMVFHAPFILQLLTDESFKEAELMLGKPMPHQAAAWVHNQLKLTGEDPTDHWPRLHWLIDSQETLEHYLKLAKETGLTWNVDFEIDIGMRRGGFAKRSSFDRALALVKAHPKQLKFTGLMGYDAHIGKWPLPFGQGRLHRRSLNRYRHFIQTIQEHYPAFSTGRSLHFNGGGSLTSHLYDGSHSPTLTDIALGSLLLAPTEFTPKKLKQQLEPAAYIAAPIIKALPGPQIPFAPWVERLWSRLRPDHTSYFIYGGHWKAVPMEPKKFSYCPIYGRSSNQELIRGPRGLQPGQHLFLHPTQSEEVLLQFPKILAHRGPSLKAEWGLLQHQFDTNHAPATPQAPAVAINTKQKAAVLEAPPLIQ